MLEAGHPGPRDAGCPHGGAVLAAGAQALGHRLWCWEGGVWMPQDLILGHFGCGSRAPRGGTRGSL